MKVKERTKEIITALSIQSGWAKLLQARFDGESQARPLSVKAVKIGGMDESAAAAALSQMVRGLPVPTNKIVLLLPKGETFSRYLNLPSSDPVELSAMARFQLEGVLPYPVQECVVSVTPIRSNEGLTKVLAVAIHRSAADRAVLLCRRAGLEVSRIGVSSEAVGRWHGVCGGQVLPNDVRLSAEIGADGIDLAVFSGTTPLYMRQVIQPVSNPEEAAARITETAQAYAKEKAGPPLDRLTLSGLLDPLGPAFDERLEAALGLPVSLVDPLVSSPFQGELVEALRAYNGEVSFSDLLGVACAPRLLAFDLLPSEAKQEQALAALKKEARRSFAIVASALLLFSLWAGGKAMAFSQRAGRLEKEAASLQANASRIETLDLAFRRAVGTRVAYALKLQFLGEALKRMPPGMEVRNLAIGADGMLVLSGNAGSLKELSGYAADCRRQPFFKNVDLRSARNAGGSNDVEFELSMEAP